MKFAALIPALLICCSCARTHFVRAPEPFKPISIEESPKARQACFEKQKVMILGANLGQVAGLEYNAIELIRYYDDSRHADASELQKKAQLKILRADDWLVFGTAYGSILGVLIGGLSAYFATSNSDFRALEAAGNGALRGFGWGSMGGLAVGVGGFAYERRTAERLQSEAAEDFNRTAKVMLRLKY